VGTDDSGFTDNQYESLEQLTARILERKPVVNFFGHCHIAPTRKTDPHRFNWNRFKTAVLKTSQKPETLHFPE
jgi:N-acetyl-anhydromuramyl-L-alanine amidase AmpD